MKAVLLLLSLIVLTNCAEDEPIVSFDMQCIDDVCLVGEWVWVQSSGSFAGVTITPETEQETRALSIDLDTYRELLNSKEIVETGYAFVKSDELSGFALDSLVLALDSGEKYAVFGDESDSDLLTLTEPCFDCWTHIYRRK